MALGDVLAQIKGHKVVLGDFNAYGKEDPMLVLTDYTAERYGKVIRAARNTFIGEEEQFGDQGAVIDIAMALSTCWVRCTLTVGAILTMMKSAR
ncbi:extracellular deoxyribonuclease Xds [Vibrio maritimus]|uniref:Extracellular deoxyribonuclease Xds n=1 Tax=Vibrio maritimus TaxID=990268 RepID=A0A090TEI9_9VIBR|nr:extracellular deoxyribonuclease Xds [Vibrio maritimus]